MDDTRLRRALGEIAEEAPEAPALWNRTQRRITQRRRRRIGVSALAVVAVVALGTGAIVAVTDDDGDNRITAGSDASADAPDAMLGVRDGRLAVMSSATGEVMQSLPVLTDGPVSEVSTVAGSPWIVYTQASARTEPCPGGPALVQARADGSDAHLLVGGGVTDPILSPDGKWVAYSMSECGSQAVVGITSLLTGENFQMSSPSNVEGNSEYPLAWTPDSARLLIANSYWGAELADIPNGEEFDATGIGPLVQVATFAWEDAVILASTIAPSGGVGDSLVRHDLGNGEKRDLFRLPGMTVTSLSFDRVSGMLLVVAVAGDGSGQVLTMDSAGVVNHGPEVAGLTSASWYASPTGPAITTTTSATTPQTTAPGNPHEIVVPDVLGLEVSAARAALESVGFVVVTSVPERGQPVWQEPPAGSTRRAGQTVYLWTCRFDATPDECPYPPADYVAAFEPATDWRAVDLSDEFWGDTLQALAPSRASLAEALVAYLRDRAQLAETQSYRLVGEGADAQIWVQQRNLPDDSTEGRDYRFYVSQTDAGWTIDRAEFRGICARGTLATDACL